MKKIYYGLLAMVSLLLSSCFDDNGNYTYKDVEEIKIEGLAEMYSNNSYNGEVLEIDPVITSNYTDLTYEWYMWSIDKEGEGSSNWDENEEPYKAELISTDKKLSYPVECPIGLYTLMLKVTSSSNGYFAMATTRFDAQTVFTRGFYILKETKDGNTELDLYSRDGNVLSDLLTATGHGAMKGKPLALGALQSHSMLDDNNESVAIHTVCVTTQDGEIGLFNTENLEQAHNAHTIITGGLDKGEIPYLAFTYGYSNYLLTGRGCNVAYIPSMMPTSGAIGIPAKTGGASRFVMTDGGYTVYYWNNEEQRIDCADCMQFGGMFTYDENGFSTKGMECLMCGLSQTDAKGYFLLKDKDGKQYIYEMAAPVVGKNTPTPHTNKRVEIPADSKLALATAYAVNAKTTNVLYYVYNNKLYTYNLPNYTENPAPVNLPGLPADETITYLSYQWQDYDNDEDNNFVYLVVGTQKGDDYKIYMYDLKAGMPKNLVKSFGGQGKVKMCVYMSSAVYSGSIRKQNNSLPN